MFAGKGIDLGLPEDGLILSSFFTPTIQLTMITLHVLAVAVGVPEEPKEGTAETSSKFSGSIYPIILTI